MEVTGGFQALPASAGDVAISGLGFTPTSVWCIATVAGTTDGLYSQGVIVGDGTTKQFCWSSTETDAVATTDSAHYRNARGIYFIDPAFVTLYEANIRLDADGFTVQPTTFDVPVDLYWWALDSDAGVSVHTGNIPTDQTSPLPFVGDNAPFTPNILGSFYSTPGGFTPSQKPAAMAGFQLGDASRYLGGIFHSRDNWASATTAVGVWDTAAQAGLNWRNAVSVSGGTSLSVDASAELQSTGVDAGQYVPVVGGAPQNRALYCYALEGLNGASVDFGTFQVPATDGTASITGLGFEPKFIRCVAFLNATSHLTGNTIPGGGGIYGGIALGAYATDLQHCEAYVQNGDSSSNVQKASSNNLLAFPERYSGVGNAVPNADGFDVNFTGLDGTQHLVVWFAFGEPGGPPELDAELVTLGWSSQDVSLSSTQILDADDLTLAWASQEVDITSGSTLDVDPVTLGWSSLEAALESFSVVDGVASMFNWTAELASITVAEEVLDVDSLTLAWVAQEADVIPAGVVGPEPLTLAWSSGLAGLVSEEQALSIENALLSFASQTAVVLDDANVVSPSDGIFAWMATDVVIANEQVNPEACAFGWTASNANIFPELEERHAHTVDVVRPDSMTVEVYSTNRRTKSGTT